MKKEILEIVSKEIPVVIAEKFVPSEFFKDRKGLFVGYGFQENILSKAGQTEEKAQFTIASFDLKENASDKKIEESLPEKHIFSETDVCAIVAALIEKQPKGEEGVLLNSGYANFFYTPSLVVDVRWLDGRWYVRGWYRGDRGWDAGRRAFSPATES